MLSSQDLLEVAFASSAGTAGRVEALRRKASGRFTGSLPGSPMGVRQSSEVARLLDEVSARAEAPRSSYSHPETRARAARPVHTARGGDSEPVRDALTPADLVWLQRLPADPAQLPFEDAVTLAQLASNADRLKSPADARLLNQVWRPVKEFHDRNAAKVALENAQAPLPRVPESALGALAEAILAEHDQLRPEEALMRASDAIQAEADRRTNARSLAISEAEQRLEQIAVDSEQRAAVVRA